MKEWKGREEGKEEGGWGRRERRATEGRERMHTPGHNDFGKPAIRGVECHLDEKPPPFPGGLVRAYLPRELRVCLGKLLVPIKPVLLFLVQFICGEKRGAAIRCKWSVSSWIPCLGLDPRRNRKRDELRGCAKVEMGWDLEEGQSLPWGDAFVERAGLEGRFHERVGFPCKRIGRITPPCRSFCPWPAAPTPRDPALGEGVERALSAALPLTARGVMGAAKHALDATAGVNRTAVAERDRATSPRFLRISSPGSDSTGGCCLQRPPHQLPDHHFFFSGTRGPTGGRGGGRHPQSTQGGGFAEALLMLLLPTMDALKRSAARL